VTWEFQSIGKHHTSVVLVSITSPCKWTTKGPLLELILLYDKLKQIYRLSVYVSFIGAECVWGALVGGTIFHFSRSQKNRFCTLFGIKVYTTAKTSWLF